MFDECRDNGECLIMEDNGECLMNVEDNGECLMNVEWIMENV